MNKPIYPVEFTNEYSYGFLSIGSKGIILKMVAFDKIEGNIYNIGFGDYNFLDGTIDDKIESNNGDAEKVLATVFSILNDFLIKHPTFTVYFKGSNHIRTRLYQIAINTYFEEFSTDYEIFGKNGDNVESFKKNKKYESFLVKKIV
jgi:hypothetical protein